MVLNKISKTHKLNHPVSIHKDRMQKSSSVTEEGREMVELKQKGIVVPSEESKKTWSWKGKFKFFDVPKKT